MPEREGGTIHTIGGYDGGIVNPFPRLRAMLEPHAPGDKRTIDLTIGEPKHQMPGFLKDKLEEGYAEHAKYPPLKGSEPLLKAMAQWLERRYGLAGKVDPARHVMVLNGSREGLFSAVFPAAGRKRCMDRPAVLMPNPFYPVYAGAAMAVGAEPVYLPATTATGDLPDLEALAADKALLERTVAFYICSPANPQGAVASEAYLRRAIELARTYDFMLFADECYSEIYTREPPPGALEVAGRTPDGFRNVLTFNSLSKRSNLPGMRSGLVAGDAEFMQRLLDFRNVSSPHTPGAIQHASAACWSEEQHVTSNRARYVEKFEAADKVLGARYGYRRPGGGFFIWLDMSQFGGGEAAALTLWKRCGVRVVPGAYLAQDGGSGNPGRDFIRVALVHDTATTREALERIVKTMS